MSKSVKPEKAQVFAKFRLSVDNGFRNEWSYVDYRRWGVMELWTGCRIREPPSPRQRPADRIEVWFNWELVGMHQSYASAQRQMDELLKLAPVNLGDLLSYLELR